MVPCTYFCSTNRPIFFNLEELQQTVFSLFFFTLGPFKEPDKKNSNVCLREDIETLVLAQHLRYILQNLSSVVC